ncbi:hypothetical protein QYM36_017676 [Artemia franciscana]|uniref:Chaperonin 10 n=1 Tax=Artemia franciscana TaxID=6661 RepID=A0AA88H859_ARTSF|nr:hypothetical protein QYM36_017676 [Artemia franciscana]
MGPVAAASPPKLISSILAVGALKNLVPLLDRVLVEKARGGIGIPEKAQQKVLQGTVVAVGPGTRNNHGQHIPVTVEVENDLLAKLES